MKSPVGGDAERISALPRAQWDVAVSNLVLHHVDDIRGFMTGLTGLVVPGGWLVLTEFTNLGQHRKVSQSNIYVELITDMTKATEEGSVNAPHHYHDEFTVESLSKLLNHFGLKNVHAEVSGTMKIWRNDRFFDVDCLVAVGQKSAK
jgi:SAM-dependent methyltransferase